MTKGEALLLDGKALAKELQAEIAREAAELRTKAGRAPGLAVILVGENPASKVYVGNKSKAARNCGFEIFDALLPESTSKEELAAQIKKFNSDPAVDGILLQLPLPKHLDQNHFLDLIDPSKDADGLHPLNQGLLQRGQGVVKPCTPLGCMKLIDLAMNRLSGGAEGAAKLKESSLAGKHALVIGRSVLVGKPVAAMLLERSATVTIAHSKTKDLPKLLAEADIIVAAVGAPGLVKGNSIKQGAILIDVGINRLPSGELAGDVDFSSAKERAGAITPVPGGVGPLTITMLLRNTLEAFRARVGKA